MIRVGVIGAAGKMGRTVLAAVQDDPALEVVAAVDHTGVGEPAGSLCGRQDITATVSADLKTLLDAEADVAIDFTHPDSVMGNIRWGIANGIHMVVGTTGLTDGELHEIRTSVEGKGPHIFIAPNFALGAVLAERFAAQASRYFPAAEIIELHHDQKADAPSGTAAHTAKLIQGSRKEPFHGPTKESVEGVRGGDFDGVRVHSVRLPGLVAHEEIIFGAPGQTLTIRHDSMDRISFMPGVLMAVKAVANLPGLTVGLDALLDLPS